MSTDPLRHEAGRPPGTRVTRAHGSCRPVLPGLLVAASVLAVGGVARAEPNADDKALASVLFQEGRRLMAEDKPAEACPKLEESQRLDPGGETLLNLALCHELDGRLMRAWSTFKDAALVARRDGRQDREIEAERHVSAIAPRLSTLTIVVPAGTRIDGLVVERDGREVGPGAWSTAIPVDGGAHVIRATAPGREPFTTTVTLEGESDHRTIEIPVLATPVVVVTPSRVSAPALPAALAPPTASAFTRSRLRGAGMGSAGVGVILLAASGYALASALDAKQASRSECFVDGCSEVGLRERRDAVSRGNVATILGVSGAVLVGAGVTFLYLARRAPPTGSSVKPALIAAPCIVVAGIEGRLW